MRMVGIGVIASSLACNRILGRTVACCLLANLELLIVDAEEKRVKLLIGINLLVDLRAFSSPLFANLTSLRIRFSSPDHHPIDSRAASQFSVFYSPHPFSLTHSSSFPPHLSSALYQKGKIFPSLGIAASVRLSNKACS